MNAVSISQLKTRPAQVIADAVDYPVAIQSRSKTKAYMVGQQLYEKLIAYIEDSIDAQAVQQTDFKKGKSFHRVAAALGI